MILSDDIKDSIRKEFSDWVETQYAGKTKEERKKFGQFFTPPELTIQMLEKFKTLDGNILDPTAGCGGLLAASVIAGANPRTCYGIELDATIAKLCRNRLAKLGVPRFNIKVGDALKDESYNFNTNYINKKFLYLKVEDLGLSKVRVILERNANNKIVCRKFIIDYAMSEERLKILFSKIYEFLNIAIQKDVYFVSDEMALTLNYFNRFFKKYLSKTFIPMKDHLILFK